MNPLLKFYYNRKSARLYKQARKQRRMAAKVRLASERAYQLDLLLAERLERLARAAGRKGRLGNKVEENLQVTAQVNIHPLKKDLFPRDIIQFHKAS